MRVIAGTARGRPLRTTATTRPTADLIKGVIFSMLEALAYKRGFGPDEDGSLAAALAWPRVLDLFAGSGGLGIEALSRGAQSADFVERERDAARIVEGNLRSTGLDERGRVHQTPAITALGRIRGPIDLVFVDPPYAEDEVLQHTWLALGSSGLLLPTSVVVLEQPAAAEPPHKLDMLSLARTRRHGRTRISLYAHASEPESA